MPVPIDIKAKLTIVGPANVKPVINALQAQLNRVKGTIGLKIDPKIAANLGGLGKKLDQFNASLRTTVTSANSANAALRGLSDTFRSLNSATKVISTVQKTQQALQRSSRSTKEAADQLERFGELSALAVRRFAAFTIATGVIFGFARAVINATAEAIEFDRQLVRISQVRNTTVRNLDSLVNTITKLSTSLGVSSTELIGVAQTLAQAGLSARDTEKALEALAETTLAPTFTDVKNTTEAAISVLAQFKLEAEDLKDVFGSINKVAADFAVEADDLTTVIRKAGGVFANAGSQLESPKQQLNELLALFTSVRATTRQSADSIATGFNTIFARLQRPATIKFLRNFNIELLDTEGRFVGAFEAVNRLNQGLRQFQTGDIRLAQITEELGGIRQLRNIIPLIREFPVALKAFDSAQKGLGSTTRDAIKAQAALAVQFQKVKEEFLALIRSIADSQTFRLLASQVLGLASALIKLADSVKPILPILTALAGLQLLRGVRSFAGGFARDLSGRTGGGIGGGGLLFGSGGIVPGSGSGDVISARLEPGEFVIPKNIVRKLGIGFFERLRKSKGFQAGGLVGLQGSGLVSDDILEQLIGQQPSAASQLLSSVKNKTIAASPIPSLLPVVERLATDLGVAEQLLENAKLTVPQNRPQIINEDTRGLNAQALSNATGVNQAGLRNFLLGENVKTQKGRLPSATSNTQNLLNLLGFSGGTGSGRAAPISTGQAANIAKFGLAGADLPTTAITPQLKQEIGDSFKDLSLTNKQYTRQIRETIDIINQGIPTEKAIQATRAKILFIQKQQAQGQGLGTQDLTGSLALQRIGGTRSRPGLLGRIGGFFRGGTGPLTPEQQLLGQNRRVAAGSVAVTAGLLLAGNLQGRGAAGTAASTGISGGLITGGLVGGLAGGPAGAIAGVAVGVVGALESFLNETNRLAQELEKSKFESAIDNIVEALGKGTVNIDKLAEQALAAGNRRIELRNDPGRSLGTLGASRFSRDAAEIISTVVGGASDISGRLFGGAGDSKFARRVRGSQSDIVDFASREGIGGLATALFAPQSAARRLKEAQEGDKQQRIENAKIITEPIIRTFDRRLRSGESASNIFGSLGSTVQKQLGLAVGGNPLNFIFDKADLIAAETALDNARVTLRKFAEELDLSTAKMDAANTVLEQQIDQQANLFNVLSGGSLGDSVKSANVIGNILDNLSGFSAGQVGGATKALQGRGLISGETANLTNSLRLIQTSVPQILNNLNVAQNPEDISNDFRNAINELIPAIDDPLKEALVRSFNEALDPGGHEDFDAKKAVRDFNIGSALGDLDKSIGNALKAASTNLLQSTQIQINAIQQTIKAQEQYQAALLNSIEVEASARERIAEVLGTDVNAARTGGLAARRNALGVQGPAGLGNRIFGLQQRGAALRSSLATAQTPEEAAKFGQELQNVNNELIKAKEALELFAKDTTLATIAADKLAKAESKRAVGREIAGGLLGNNRLGFFKQISALERFQGGDLRVLATAFEDVQAGIELQARFLRAGGREQEARGVERKFEEGLGQILGPEFAKFIIGAGKEEDQARQLQVQAAELQIEAAKETLNAQKALLNFFGGNQGKAAGGMVRGGGTGTSDSIPARLSNGEFIMRSAAVNSLGVDALNFMNQTGELPGFAHGGVVPRRQRIQRRLERDQRFADRFEKAALIALRRRIRLGRGNSALADANRAVIAGGININRVEPGVAGALIAGVDPFIDSFTFRQKTRGGNFSSVSQFSTRTSPHRLARLARRHALPIGSRFRRGFASGGLVDANGGVSLNTSAIASLNNFALAANNLAQAMGNLQNIPSTIQLVGNHTLNVNINGAQALANIMPALQEYVLTQINMGLSKYNQQLTTG